MNINANFPTTISEIGVYNASFGTRELAPALSSAIKSIHPKPCKILTVDSLEINRNDVMYIIICPAGLAKEIILPKYYITWQLEFMIGPYNNPGYINILRGALANWDYSTFNIKLLEGQYGIKSIHVPPGFNHTIASPDIVDGSYLYNDQGKDIDILFLGYCDAYPRRVLFRDNCNCTGLKTFFVSNFDLEGMKQMIRRAKVCINLAAQDIFVLATVRLNILLSNQACIVSEMSIDNDADELYSKHGICFVPYEDLIPRAYDLVHNYEVRRDMAIKSYQWYRYERDWANIVNFPLLLPAL